MNVLDRLDQLERDPMAYALMADADITGDTIEISRSYLRALLDIARAAEEHVQPSVRHFHADLRAALAPLLEEA